MKHRIDSRWLLLGPTEMKVWFFCQINLLGIHEDTNINVCGSHWVLLTSPVSSVWSSSGSPTAEVLWTVTPSYHPDQLHNHTKYTNAPTHLTRTTAKKAIIDILFITYHLQWLQHISLTHKEKKRCYSCQSCCVEAEEFGKRRKGNKDIEWWGTPP